MRYTISADPRIHCKKLDEIIDYPAAVQLTGEFSEESAFIFRQQLLSAEAIALKSKQRLLPITIDSFGGDVYALFGCIDAIKALDPSIIVATIVTGKAMSAGAILATCGHPGYRFMSPNATIMYHTASAGTEGTIKDIEIAVDEFRRLNDKLLQIGSHNLGKKSSFLEKLLKEHGDGDFFIDSKLAVELGIVDRIGLPRFNINIGYEIQIQTADGEILDLNAKPKKKEFPKTKDLDEAPEEQPAVESKKKKK